MGGWCLTPEIPHVMIWSWATEVGKLPSAQVTALVRSLSMVSASWTDRVWFHPMLNSWQTLMFGWFRWSSGTGSHYLKEIFSWSNIHFEVGSHWEQVKHEENKSILLKSRTKMVEKLLGGLAFTVNPQGTLQCECSPHFCGKSRLQVGMKYLQPEFFPYSGGKLWLKQMSKLQWCTQEALLILCMLLHVVVSIFWTRACCVGMRE